VIQEVNRQLVAGVDQCNRAIKAANGQVVPLLVNHGGVTHYLAISTAE